MNDQSKGSLGDYYEEAGSWASERAELARRNNRTAWIVAGVLGAVAILEAIGIVVMMPLKTTEPYTLMVDRQTGYVQALKPVTPESIAPDAALTRSFLVQYVIAREEFDIDTLKTNYRKVALWSTGEARERYVSSTNAGNPASPLATLPRRALVEVQIRSVSSLNADTALVRFATTRTDPGAQRAEPQLWAAVIKYQFSSAAMSAEDRFTNPLGFQVVRYRRDAEVPPPPPAAPGPAVAPPNGARSVPASPSPVAGPGPARAVP